MQLTSDLVLTIAGERYDLSLTQEVLAYCLDTVFEGERIHFYPPEDVPLIKALLQRGTEVGKYDIEDIKNFVKTFLNLRQDYLQERIRAIGAEKRVGNIFSAHVD